MDYALGRLLVGTTTLPPLCPDICEIIRQYILKDVTWRRCNTCHCLCLHVNFYGTLVSLVPNYRIVKGVLTCQRCQILTHKNLEAL